MELRCYFCGKEIVHGEYHAAEDCRSVLMEQRDSLQEQLRELQAATGSLPGAAPTQSSTSLP